MVGAHIASRAAPRAAPALAQALKNVGKMLSSAAAWNVPYTDLKALTIRTFT